jgi:hypothetical protein
MKTIIAGSRQIEDFDALSKTIEDAGWDIDEVVSGTCRGVDVMGEEWAQSFSCRLDDTWPHGRRVA